MAKKNKIICILSVILLFLAVPIAVSATETVSYQSTMIPGHTSPQLKAVELGSLVIGLNPLLEGEHGAVITLPREYSLIVPGAIQAVEDPHVRLETYLTGRGNEFQVRINYEGVNKNLTFIVPIKTTIPTGATGDIQLDIKRIEGQFTDGSVNVGRIAGGNVNITSDTEKIRIIKPETRLPFSIEIEEDRDNVIRAGAETLKLVLPEGFIWEQTEVKVDILSDGGYLPETRVDDTNSRIMYVDIREEGERKKSSFRISGEIMAERTILPEAEVKVDVSGKDLISAQNIVIVQVVKPEVEARFIVGRDVYFFNGRALTMDVLPYTKEGRLFLPLRYVGLSLGVDPDNIKWDGQIASLTLGDKNVQIRPGMKQLLVNGKVVEMDVAAELQFPGRVMLPYRFIAEAFDATVDWDADSNTVTMEL